MLQAPASSSPCVHGKSRGVPCLGWGHATRCRGQPTMQRQQGLSLTTRNQAPCPPSMLSAGAQAKVLCFAELPGMPSERPPSVGSTRGTYEDNPELLASLGQRQAAEWKSLEKRPPRDHSLDFHPAPPREG